MVECSYCGKEIKKGTGVLLVNNKGQNFNFCSSKCKKYTAMKRKKGRWAIPNEKS